ncbi:restriction endonuclease [Tenacibaculum singaporense]|uniref:Restriction endonuclease n=1 Tax=Tenacibaculum singaporense TaxID=2358479 RepID=A0A3S8RA81_9FLAO|nr:restriction endonuclease [Tenacibaculum singaporense]AZJ36624.1 restriction endonuclease [Tenacibaculum singaporense]
MQELKNRIPDFQTIMLPMLQLLSDGKSKTLNEVMQALAQHFKLTSEDLKIKVPSGQMGLFRNRVGWTRSYLKKAGLIKYPERGVYQITEEGKKFLATNPSKLRMKQLEQFPKYKEWRTTFNGTNTKQKEITNTQEQTPEEVLAATVTELKNELATELLDKLKENSFQYFENFVIQLLQKMGYGEFREEASQHTGKTGDDGIDGIISQDRLGLENVYIQAKRFTNNSVGSPEIRNFIGSLALQGVNKGVFLTTSRFSSSAIQTAQDSKQQKIVLIDGKELTDLAIEYNLGVQVADTIQIKKIDLDYFEE